MPSKDTFAEPSSFEAQRKDEEHLPVYQRSEQAGSNILPASQAPAEEVRQFIIHVLVSRRQLSLDDARRVAARWNAGAGLELRTYSPSMYLEVFGSEHGWILYKELRPIIDAESQGKTIDHYGPGMSHIASFRSSNRSECIDTPGTHRTGRRSAIRLFRHVSHIHQFEKGCFFVWNGLRWHTRKWARHLDDYEDWVRWRESKEQGHR